MLSALLKITTGFGFKGRSLAYNQNIRRGGQYDVVKVDVKRTGLCQLGKSKFKGGASKDGSPGESATELSLSDRITGLTNCQHNVHIGFRQVPSSGPSSSATDAWVTEVILDLSLRHCHGTEEGLPSSMDEFGNLSSNLGSFPWEHGSLMPNMQLVIPGSIVDRTPMSALHALVYQVMVSLRSRRCTSKLLKSCFLCRRSAGDPPQTWSVCCCSSRCRRGLIFPCHPH